MVVHCKPVWKHKCFAVRFSFCLSCAWCPLRMRSFRLAAATVVTAVSTVIAGVQTARVVAAADQRSVCFEPRVFVLMQVHGNVIDITCLHFISHPFDSLNRRWIYHDVTGWVRDVPKPGKSNSLEVQVEAYLLNPPPPSTPSWWLMINNLVSTRTLVLGWALCHLWFQDYKGLKRVHCNSK